MRWLEKFKKRDSDKVKCVKTGENSTSRFETEIGFASQVLEGPRHKVTTKLLETVSSHQACLSSLYFPDMVWRRDDVEIAHPKTCTWILEHKLYQAWKQQNHGLLWIKGKPGAGKSTIMNFVFQEFNELPTSNSDTLILSFFFHGRGVELQHSPIGMFRSLTHQLVSKDSTASAIFLQKYEKKVELGEIGLDCKWPLTELERYFSLAVLAAADERNVLIFIDALDEVRKYETGPNGQDSYDRISNATAARDLVGYFHKLADQTNSQNKPIKICISSRHYPMMDLNTKLEICVEHNNHDDIALYIRDELRDQYTRRSDAHTDQKPWMKIEKELINRANNIFQWARLVIPLVIVAHREGQSWNEVHYTLAQVPAELSELYTYILEKVIKKEYKLKTLALMQWICLAERSLSVEELRHAVSLSAFDSVSAANALDNRQPVPFTNELIESDDRMLKLITSWSGGLAEVKHTKWGSFVQLIHQSVTDFFFYDGFKFFESPPGLINDCSVSSSDIVGRYHGELSMSCLKYLNHIRKSEDAKNLKTDEFRGFVKYAMRWPSHASKAESKNIGQKALIDYLKQHDHILGIWNDLYNQILVYDEVTIKSGTTLLHISAIWNLPTVAIELLKNRSYRQNTINSIEEEGNCALHFAAAHGHIAIVDILLNHEATISAKNKAGRTPLEFAASHQHGNVIKRLLRRGADVNDYTEESGTALQRAALTGNVAIVELLLRNGADLDTNSGEYGNALQAAAGEGHIAVVRLLMEQGANINMKGGCFGDALTAACFSGSLEIVSLLLDNGAEVDGQSRIWGTALQLACRYGYEDIVDLLLERRADFMLVTVGGNNSPIAAAACGGNLNIVRRLIREGADVNAMGRSGMSSTALMTASRQGKLDIVRLLVESGADLNMKGMFNAVDEAELMGHETVVLYLRSRVSLAQAS